MQLIEFFLWKHLKNKSINSWLSFLACCIVNLQVITIILMIPNLYIRYTFLFCIFLFYIINRIVNNIYPSNWSTTIGKNGHLSWEWMNYTGYSNIFNFLFLLFYVVSLLFIGSNVLSLFFIFFLCISIFYYYKYKTFGTIWCWSVNLIFLYFIINILLVQPFYEYNGLC
jgi:hypothetical protein